MRPGALRDGELGLARGEPPTGSEEPASELEEPAAGFKGSASGGSGRPPPGRSCFLRDRDWWCIWSQSRGVDGLYDAGRDPTGKRDLAPEHPEVVRRLREQIRAWEAETRRFLQALPEDGLEPRPPAPRFPGRIHWNRIPTSMTAP